MRSKFAFFIAALSAGLFACAGSSAMANEVQSLTAKVDGAAFVSDDDGILLVPVSDTISLGASTQGAMAYPPPKSPVDHLAIMCKHWTPGTTRKYEAKDFSANTCEVKFERDTNNASKQASADFALDKQNADNVFDIASASGKTIEGTFRFHLNNAAGTALVISDGKFKAEDRQE